MHTIAKCWQQDIGVLQLTVTSYEIHYLWIPTDYKWWNPKCWLLFHFHMILVFRIDTIVYLLLLLQHIFKIWKLQWRMLLRFYRIRRPGNQSYISCPGWYTRNSLSEGRIQFSSDWKEWVANLYWQYCQHLCICARASYELIRNPRWPPAQHARCLRNT